MNILFVFFTLPDLSQSSMYSDMVNVFHDNHHTVFPMAPINGDNKHSFISSENGIEVLRVKTKDVFSNDMIKKGVANLLLPYQYKKAFRKFWKNKPIDLIIVATPSVMFADFIMYTKHKTRAKVLLLQKDIFPQNAVDLGFMKKGSFIYNFFKRNEIKILKSADKIGCTSKGNRKYLLKNYSFLNKDNLHVIYNSTKLLKREPENSVNIKSKYNIKNRFVIVFGGNLGKPQQLENVLELAKNTVNYKDVLFLIIGKGTEVDILKRQTQVMNLKNILYIDNVPREEYFNLLSVCNIGLISLHQDFTVPNTPMKLNDYLNAGIPILASIDRGNDLGEMLIEHAMGLYAFADTPEDLFNAFKKMYVNREYCKEMGENGYKFCRENLSAEKSYKEIIKLFK